MPGIRDALRQIDNMNPREKVVYSKIAKDEGVSASTLSRRHRGVQSDITTKNLRQRKVTPQQEEELVQYTIGLTERHSEPTRATIINFVRELADVEVSQTWVTHFFARHRDVLTNRYTNPMTFARHEADSYDKYKAYFDLVEQKIAEYSIEARHTYNMDEKGFMAGVLGKQKRVFSKASWTRHQSRQSAHDGNREWITILACVCGDGTWLPPGLVFSADSATPQSTWLSDLDKGKHRVYTTVTPSGWSNDDTALGWVEQVFDPLTKDKTRRAWRLLIMDGHGSHITLKFLSHCARRRILVLIFPPHSTQTLQPLDVACFSPLSQAYTKHLGEHLAKQQNLVPFRKSDFFSIFWKAWEGTFTEKLIKQSFEVTGIAPVNPNRILHRFKKSDAEAAAVRSYSTSDDWRTSDKLWRRSVKDVSTDDAKELRQILLHLHNQNQLLKAERDNLRSSLAEATRKPTQGKALPLIQRKETRAKTQWWSPRAVNEAQHLQKIFEQEEGDKALADQTAREIKQQSDLLKAKLAQEKKEAAATKRLETAERKRLRGQEVANRKADREAQRRTRDAEKSSKLPKQAKGKASQKSQAKVTKKRGRVGARREAVAREPSPPPPLTRASTGRHTRPPKKLW